MIPQGLTINTMHIHLELEGLLLSKTNILEPNFFLCTICNYFVKNKKMPKLPLANGLWIGITQITLPNLTMVEENLIARYCCWKILFK
jgi:hypothetical protein